MRITAAMIWGFRANRAMVSILRGDSTPTKMDHAETHRHLLVCCNVTNSSGEASIRYVEHSLYRLWQYMMANKHHIAVRDAAVCLWLPKDELDSHDQLFRHAGRVEEVHRVSFASYDQDSGICNTTQRFVAAADSDRVQALLLGRISRESKRNGDFAMELEVGHAVVNSESADLGTLGQPLDATL